MNQRRARPVAIAVLIVAGVGLITGCGPTPSTTSDPTAVTTTASTAVSPPVGITEQDNRTTVHLRTGQVVQLSLHSTYWSDPVSAPTSVLAIEGRVSRVAGGRCPIGSGCGTLYARFDAIHPGIARLQAQRTTCGEARGCTPDQSQFAVTIVVS